MRSLRNLLRALAPSARWPWAVVVLLLPLLPGCQSPVENGDLPALGEGAQTVQLLILEGPGGTALALVPVYIDGKGPFPFALDTGASHTLIDRELAAELELEVAGEPVETTGVAAVSQAIPVKVGAWRVGDVELPPRELVTLDMAASSRRLKLQGLLGSDVLSQFGTIQVDYRGQKLTLGGA